MSLLPMKSKFDDIKHTDSFGNEYWNARELQGVLGYRTWESFEEVVDKAKEAVKTVPVDIGPKVLFRDV